MPVPANVCHPNATFGSFPHVIRMSLSGRSPAGNALFPRRERSVPMLGTPPKVPLASLENAAGTGHRRYWNKSQVIERVMGISI